MVFTETFEKRLSKKSFWKHVCKLKHAIRCHFNNMEPIAFVHNVVISCCCTINEHYLCEIWWITNFHDSITCRFYIEVYEGPLAVDKKCSTLCNQIKRRRFRSINYIFFCYSLKIMLQARLVKIALLPPLIWVERLTIVNQRHFVIWNMLEFSYLRKSSQL